MDSEDSRKVHAQNPIAVEITNVSGRGLWVRVHKEELFLPFSQFPWFEEAPVRKVFNVELRGSALHWPDLDVDLTLDSIQNPQAYPLVSKLGFR